MSKLEPFQRSLRHIRRELETLEYQLEIAGVQTGHPAGSREPERLDGIGGRREKLDLEGINSVLRRLAAEKSRQQILSIYLDAVTELVERAVLFSRVDRRFLPWKGIGFELDKLPILTLEQTGSLLIQSAIQKQIVIAGRDLERDFPWAGKEGGQGRQACCLPLILGDFVPLVLYADNPTELPLDSLELLTQLTILVLKNHELRRLMAPQQATTRPGTASPVEETAPGVSAQR